MRRALIAGNWKMNLDRAASVGLAQQIVGRAAEASHVDIAVCPAGVYLSAVGEVVRGTPVALGAQNMHPNPNGAFTGETSASMLVDLGCRYVIAGHSERRHILGESDELINRKVKAALAAGLIPIVCVGELLAEREAGRTGEVVRRQFAGSLAGIAADDLAKSVIAYEPVWAIGTGKVATPEQAQAVHLDLRKIMTERYNGQIAQTVRILYGGSVKPDNAAVLLSQPDVDGALVGGASLKSDDFFGIVVGAPR